MFRLLSLQGKDEDWIAELREEFPDDPRAGRFPVDEGVALYDAQADDDLPASDAGAAPAAASGDRPAGPPPPAVMEPPAVVEPPPAMQPPAVVGPPAVVEPPAVMEPPAVPAVAEPPAVVEPLGSRAPAAVAATGAGIDPVTPPADDPWQLFADVLDAQQSTLVALAERLDQVEARLDEASRRLPATAPRPAAGPRPDAPTMREVVDALRASALGSAARLGREVARRRR